MKIAVCDDEKEIRESIAKKIRLLYEQAETLEFDSGESLLAYPEPIDVLFLDIQMDPIDGMETARRLRASGSSAILIFVTALEEYVFRAFDVGAFHYLLKPIEQKKFYEVLHRAAEELSLRKHAAEEESPAIVIKQGSTTRRVYLREILYAEVYNRKITIHAAGGDMEYYGKMAELEKQAGAGFFRTHRAYLVNLRYVLRYDAHTVWMEKGQALMAKQNYAPFVKRYLQYNREQAQKNGKQ